jgi:glycerophosphoryl diester phosphodiesterase
MMHKKILWPLALVLGLGACSSMPSAIGGSGDWPYATLGGKRPLVIAHRGASGVLPEHTIPAYLRAINDGADCIEPDLVMTKDGVLVDRHDIYLSTTTDVATRPEFASRKRKGTDAAHADQEDWYVADFTLAEIKTLRAVQPFRGRSKAFDKLYDVPTFAEVVDVALANHTVAGGPVCVYPEAKSPALHSSLGFDMGAEILRVLTEKGLDKPGSPVFIQSFEPQFVKAMAARTDLPVVMLVGDRAALDAAMKVEGAPFWDGLGATHQTLFEESGKPSSVIRDAHARGIAVHAWTYRDDAPFRGDPDVETSMKKALALGLDGFFTDFPFTGYRVVNEIATGGPAPAQ